MDKSADRKLHWVSSAILFARDAGRLKFSCIATFCIAWTTYFSFFSLDPIFWIFRRTNVYLVDSGSSNSYKQTSWPYRCNDFTETVATKDKPHARSVFFHGSTQCSLCFSGQFICLINDDDCIRVSNSNNCLNIQNFTFELMSCISIDLLSLRNAFDDILHNNTIVDSKITDATLSVGECSISETVSDVPWIEFQVIVARNDCKNEFTVRSRCKLSLIYFQLYTIVLARFLKSCYLKIFTFSTPGPYISRRAAAIRVFLPAPEGP